MAAEKHKSVRRGVSERVYADLKSRILTGQYQPGEKLPSESRLCEEYGVSRVSLRAAISRLTGTGLLVSRQGEGTFVLAQSDGSTIEAMLPFVVLNKPDRIDMFEFRRIMEIESVGLAAMRADAATLEKMYKTIDGMRSTDDPEIIAQYDLAFHHLVAQATANTIIMKVFEVLRESYLALLRHNTAIMGANGARYHELICRSIEIRSAEKAKQYMADHLAETIRVTDAGKR